MLNLIHPTAIIDPTLQIGKNVTIGPFCIIGPNVKLSDNVWLQSNIRIDRNTQVGDGCKIYHGASIGNDPQDLKYAGEHSILEIGSQTTIREFVTLHRGTKETGKTTVGSHCLLMDYVHVAHDCTVGDHTILSNSVQLAGHVEVGDWVTVGGIVGVHQFSRIGSHCMIEFGSKVKQDLPPYILAAREPLRPTGINKIGLSRRGFSDETIRLIDQAYRFLYRENLPLEKAVEKIGALGNSPEIRLFADFLVKSKRGITR
jgi:UDP-N-acetylglucosamine acyltransferase